MNESSLPYSKHLVNMLGLMNEDVVREKLQIALDAFFRENSKLLESGIREPALSHQLAVHLQREFDGYDVDAEYDKVHVAGVPAAKKYISADGTGKSAIPDIIIHRRQEMDNLVAIEIKKSTNRRGRKADYDKLRAYLLPPYSYRHAVFLEIGLSDGNPHSVMEFRSSVI